MSTETEQDRCQFLSGVVEGFYGRPWTFDQRKELFFRMNRLGLNFYLYAPKDDIKHRTLWREMYSVEEMENLKGLIDSAKAQNVIFIYAISPGLDMVFSSKREVDILKRKMKQISDVGCEAFALLYDDIDPEIRAEDRHAFESFAHAQVAVTNEVFAFLKKPKYFLVCPTEYAASRAVPTVDKSPYLTTLGTKLHPSIDIMWTGSKVVSRVITTHSIKVVSNVLKRKPIIWDNIHANDYDQRRLFLGPYDGRPIQLYTHLRGILTNPNCEFESNFIAIHTLSTWIKCAQQTYDTNEPEKDPNQDSKEVNIIEPMEADPVPGDVIGSGDVVGSDDVKDAVLSEIEADLKESDGKIDSSMETDTESEPNPCKLDKDNDACVMSKTKPVDVLKAYDPEEAVKLAVKEWLIEFHQTKSVTFNTYAKSGAFAVANTAPPIQTTSPIPTATTTTTSASNVSGVKMATRSTSSSIAVAKEKSRNIKKTTTADSEPLVKVETSTNVETNIGEEMEVEKLEKKEEEENRTKENHDIPIRLTFDDLLLLVDFFYLPHQHGKRALQILNDFKWLKANSIKSDGLAENESEEKVTEWKRRAKIFHEYVENVSQMFIRLSDTPNRAVLYDLYPYIWDVKEVVLLLDSFVNWLDSKTRKRKDKSFIPDDPEPWVIRGGICGEMQRLLPNLEGGSDLFTQGAPQVPTPSVYTIRPYMPTDEEELYEICLSTCDDGQDGHDLFPNEPNMAGDRFIGPHISICPETVFVIEDKFGLCGYGAAVSDVKQFYKQYKEEWLPKMCAKYTKPKGSPSDFVYSEQICDSFHKPSIFLPDELYEKYPAHVRIDLLSRAHSLGIGKRLLACILSVLKSEGCRGVYAEITSTNRDALDFYTRLGFADVSLQNNPADVVIVGRTI